MDKQMMISELKEKALDGDEKALGEYNEYVNRGEAPRIAVQTKFKFSLETLSLMTAGYEAESEKRGEDLETSMFGKKEIDPTKFHEVINNPIAKISSGYALREQVKAERIAKSKEVTANTRQKSQEMYENTKQSKTFGEMLSSPFEKISNSYK
ncbi:hypothetical protein [Priestia endophytica]|uniref:hypothetical protein n=1 Tax=Priestia endophytica TaxID=135735 RepID=UPI00227E23B6|nr:hypothetical protein [Priestia endophytica]MCY8233689.1 hypothetical protein [Priestia endophytica]